MAVMWDFIKKQLLKNKNSYIAEYDGKKYTFQNLYQEIESVGNQKECSRLLRAKCVILCEKSIEAVKALFFCWKTNMIAIPLSLQYGESQCDSVIELTQPDYIITDNESICEKYNNAFIIGDSMQFSKCINEDADLRDIELIMCTSGTTGTPKASMLSGIAIKTNVNSIAEYFTVDKSDLFLISRPIYHCAVLVGELLLSIFVGANILLYSEGFNPMFLSNILCKEGVTVMCGTPSLFKGLSDYLVHKNKSGKLRTIALSGEYLLKEYANSIKVSFPEAKVFNVYGLTEAGPRVSYLSWHLFEQNSQSVGKPLSGVRIKIVDEYGSEKNNNDVGNVWINTPSIMKGYYKNIKETQNRFHGKWFDTKDVGFVDEQGYLYIVGRSDDMIIKSGINIYPQEIEKKISTLSEVKSVMAYSVLDYGIEQIIVEVILNDEYKSITSNELTKKFSEILPGYMMPKFVKIVTKFPRNATGKKIRPIKKVRKIND